MVFSGGQKPSSKHQLLTQLIQQKHQSMAIRAKTFLMNSNCCCSLPSSFRRAGLLKRNKRERACEEVVYNRSAIQTKMQNLTPNSQVNPIAKLNQKTFLWVQAMLLRKCNAICIQSPIFTRLRLKCKKVHSLCSIRRMDIATCTWFGDDSNRSLSRMCLPFTIQSSILPSKCSGSLFVFRSLKM